ncbi:MAG: hypothetical protein LBM93_03200 [Oscillospiraceae bacterium]|jgi:hypothetical protein|nr:hypothetical protein [Oscillospiraceae bacterium]
MTVNSISPQINLYFAETLKNPIENADFSAILSETAIEPEEMGMTEKLSEKNGLFYNLSIAENLRKERFGEDAIPTNELNEEQKNYLKEKYNFEEMTGNSDDTEYFNFMYDLVSMNVVDSKTANPIHLTPHYGKALDSSEKGIISNIFFYKSNGISPHRAANEKYEELSSKYDWNDNNLFERYSNMLDLYKELTEYYEDRVSDYKGSTDPYDIEVHEMDVAYAQVCTDFVSKNTIMKNIIGSLFE